LREVIIAADAMTAATFTTIINKRCRTCAVRALCPLRNPRAGSVIDYERAYHKRKDQGNQKKRLPPLKLLPTLARAGVVDYTDFRTTGDH
jgi:hypothetical protein